MIKFYFPLNRIFKISEIKSEDECLAINLPEHCPFCDTKFEIDYIGSENSITELKKYCDHIAIWPQIWEMRIQIDLKNDGCFCDKCTEWSPMAVANLAENKFRCYRCRQNPY